MLSESEGNDAKVNTPIQHAISMLPRINEDFVFKVLLQ